MSIDVGDTARCPIAEACASCGRADQLRVRAADLPMGVGCLTVCDSCKDRPDIRLSLSSAALMVLSHCEHLGIDLDQMAAAMQAERHPDADSHSAAGRR